VTLVIPGPGAGAVLWERKAPWVPRDGLCECTHFKLFKLFQIISKLQSSIDATRLWNRPAPLLHSDLMDCGSAT